MRYLLPFLVIFICTSCLQVDPAVNTATDTTGTTDGTIDPGDNSVDIAFSLDDVLGGVYDGQSEVDLIPQIVIHTNFSFEPTFINTQSIILSTDSSGKNAVDISNIIISTDGLNFTFSPLDELHMNTKYYVLVTDKIESPLNNGRVLMSFSFTTGSFSTPSVSLLAPTELTNVTLSPLFQISFSKDVINVNTATVILRNESEFGQEVSLGNITQSGKVYLVSPLRPLLPNTKYVLQITKDIMDNMGNHLVSDRKFEFTTSNLTTPTVSLLEPTNNAHDVSISPIINIKFSTNMIGINESTIQMHQGGQSGPLILISHVSLAADNMYTFHPLDNLSDYTEYYIVISSDIEDELGNKIHKTVFSFTTGDSTAQVFH